MTLEFPRLDRAEHKELPAFLVEMDTLLGLVERCLLELDNAADSPLVSVQLRSHLESVSSNASRLSLPRTEEIARESARLVDRLSTRQTHATTKVVDALFASTGLLRSLLEHLEAHGNEGSIDARRHLAELSALGQPAASQTVELRSFNLSNTDTLGESFGSLQEINEEFVAESRDHLEQVQALLDMFASSQVTNDRLDEIARAFHTMKGVASILRHRALEALTHAAESVVAGLREGQIKPRLSHGTTLYHVVDVARQMLSRIEQGARDADVVHAPLINMLSVMNEDRSDTIQDSTEPQLTALPPQPTTPPPEADTHTGGARTDRPHRIDQLHIEQISDLTEQLSHAHTRGDLAELGTLIAELQRNVATMQTQPAGAILNKMPRLIRATAKRSGKRARLELVGEDIRLSRSTLSTLNDILTQVVRNAVTHGIEMPGQRLEAGKPAEGLVRVTVEEHGNEVSFTIQDDGAGIDTEGLRRRAVRRGVITSAQATLLTPEQSAHLLFEPGLSTAGHLGGLAGRGIGMDIARTLVEQLAGRIELTSTPGRGTSFRICVPKENP